ncbi:MAG: hypothetical protein RLZZ127_2157 [Planctomycetota bacterium]|jgi:hypothetical protein
MRAAALAALAALLAAADPATAPVAVGGPLVRVVDLPGTWAGAGRLRALVAVDGTPPVDLGVGAWTADRDGRWFQALHGPLASGTTSLAIDLRRARPEGHRGDWTPAASAEMDRGGLFLWSAQPASAALRVLSWTIDPAPAATGPWILREVAFPSRVATGERWELALRPDPYPADPYDPEAFRLDATVTAPDGAQFPISGYHDEPQRLDDGGDRELAVPDGAHRFRLRLRPWLPGTWRISASARWAGGPPRSFAVDIVAEGPPRDRIVRVDAGDPRFLSVGARSGTAAFVWPVGINLRSVNDTRSAEVLQTRLTPDRGVHAYRAYLDRLADCGGDVLEVWMSAWNLALEWSQGWPGFHGAGRYHQGNAARIDRLLDDADARSIRVLLVLNNHGQTSPKVDKEWPFHPYNRTVGGWLERPEQAFSDVRAWAMQERLRRYLAARYADHPALIGWKLYSEVNLTAAKGDVLVEWHRRAAASMAARDPYGRFVSTHWSNDWTTPERRVAALPEIGLVGIDAYRRPRERPGPPQGIADLLLAGTTDPVKGLQLLAKPVWVQEYGGWWNGGSPEQIEAELRAGPWAALVAGYAAGPLLWWYEFTDQRGLWRAYAPVRAFLAGEDLRGADARPVRLECGEMRFAAAWTRPGRLLGWVGDRRWIASGARVDAAPERVVIGRDVAPGRIELEWWDPAAGVPAGRTGWDHPGGMLAVDAPPFATHLAWKLQRR